MLEVQQDIPWLADRGVLLDGPVVEDAVEPIVGVKTHPSGLILPSLEVILQQQQPVEGGLEPGGHLGGVRHSDLEPPIQSHP